MYTNIQSTPTEIHASEKEGRLSKTLSKFKTTFLKLYSDTMPWGIELRYDVESQKTTNTCLLPSLIIAGWINPLL